MIDRQPAVNSGLQYYKIDAAVCSLQKGDRVTTQTVIGYDFDTRTEITARCAGHVERLTFIGPDHALLIVVRPD